MSTKAKSAGAQDAPPALSYDPVALVDSLRSAAEKSASIMGEFAARQAQSGHSLMADELGISVKTAMSHREHIMEKLDLHSRTELIKFALREGVITIDR